MLATVAVVSVAACSTAGTPTASTDHTHVAVTATRTVPTSFGADGVSLSPNGEKAFVVRDGRACILTIADGSSVCAPKGAVHPGPLTAGAWAPDDSAVVFTDDYQLRHIDPDIWVMQAGNGSVRDITDDHVTGSLATGSLATTPGVAGALIDMQPTWLNPTTIVFGRQPGPSATSLEISSVKATGGAVTGLFRVDSNWQFLDGIAASPDGTTVAYSIADDDYHGAAVHLRRLHGDTDDTKEGTKSGTAGGTGAGTDRIVAHSKYEASLLSFSADGKYLLVDNRTPAAGYTLPKDSGATVITVADRTSSRVTVGGGAWFPTWSPTGHAMAFLTRGAHGDGEVNTVTAPGGTARKLTPATPFPVVTRAVQWGPGEVVLTTAKGLTVMTVTG